MNPTPSMLHKTPTPSMLHKTLMYLAAPLLAGLFSSTAATYAAPTVEVSAGIDQAPWDGLLKKYVNDRGLVSYAAWKASSDDLQALDRYIGEFAATGKPLPRPLASDMASGCTPYCW